MGRRKQVRFTPVRHLLLIVLLLASTLSSGGCFSMSPVPPAPGLPRMDEADMRSTSRLLADAPAQLEAAWGKNIIFVRPLLNGQDVGWFILDTGASGWTISEDAARRANLEAVGTAMMQGVDATTVFRCTKARLGPVEFQNLHLSGLNMHHASGVFGRDVVGICGRELFEAGILELDVPHHRCAMHAASSSHLPDAGAWHSLQMRRGVPVVQVEYAGELTGSFMLDTGCDRAIRFSGAAVRAHDLLHTLGGSAGVGWAASYNRLDREHAATLAQVKVAGEELGPVAAMLGNPDASGESPSDLDGLIGMELLAGRVLWLDEAGGRLALTRPLE